MLRHSSSRQQQIEARIADGALLVPAYEAYRRLHPGLKITSKGGRVFFTERPELDAEGTLIRPASARADATLNFRDGAIVPFDLFEAVVPPGTKIVELPGHTPRAFESAA